MARFPAAAFVRMMAIALGVVVGMVIGCAIGFGLMESVVRQQEGYIAYWYENSNRWMERFFKERD